MRRLIIAISFMIGCSLLLPPIISVIEDFAERQEVQLYDPEPDTQGDPGKTQGPRQDHFPDYQAATQES